MPRIITVLPTYNEAQNLVPMVTAILRHVPDGLVLVVDDNSPDGTGRLAEQLVEKHAGKVAVLHRNNKEGLGRAYLAGFAHALDLGAEQIIQMDADFSHPPAVLPRLLEALQAVDIAIGSRYVKGGGTKNWGLKRRLLSRMGNLYARLILSLPLRDATGGLKAWRRQALASVLRCPIESTGYNFQIEMSARAIAAGFTCREVPFIFEERRAGVSKMSGDIIWEALLKTYRLRGDLKKMTPAPLV